MKVDYHIHLEEGPYSISFIEKSLKAMEHFNVFHEEKHTKEWLSEAINQMSTRLQHSEYSTWWLDLYLQEALNKGIKEVGIVDHLYRFKETRDYFTKYIDVESEDIGQQQADWLNKVMVRDLHEFTTFITSQKEKWAAKGVTLRLGIEADYFVGGEDELQSLLNEYSFDYVIGSVHFYNGWGFDNPQLQHKFQEYDLTELYKNHFETVKKAASSGLFDFIAHLDNIKVFNYRPSEAELEECYREVARTLVKHDVATEINAGLYYRYPVREFCPSPAFLGILVEEGVKFTVSSDSHYPNDLGIYSDEILAMLADNGVHEVATFHQRKRENIRCLVKN
ncbi:histidinol phosphate phosphatase domain-containing protein [Bacillus niameyensis]|uniref:histidinol phosphate phosphatase domain-containing protein n=1 Tax=Bacillus niameyensis TaxID=1522308 RepID=UPI000782207E|nr:histidinol phosphate phosphatase domain-containing protein [Bacillus niameyensis]